ncbi:MAG: S9 family peptidase, partial [Acidobacteria bacterium]|nr:S9 family peptidase [Acidobacteriota bacterium]
KSTLGLQDSLYREMLGRIQETDQNVPYRKGDWLYYSRTEEGRQYPIYCRRRVTAGGRPAGPHEAPEQVVLDLNQLAEGRAYFSVGDYEVSDDGRWLAFTTDDSGFRQYSLFVKNLESGEVTPRLAERVTSVAWASDNQTVFYTEEDEVTKRSHRFHRCRIDGGGLELLYEEENELYRIGVARTRSGGYIVLTSSSFTTSEVRYIAADRPTGRLSLLRGRREGHEYYLDHIGDRFYLRTNDRGKNFRLVAIPAGVEELEEWPATVEEMVPHRVGTMLTEIDCFVGHLLALEREDGLSRMRVLDLGRGDWHPIEFPEPVYVAGPHVNAEFESSAYRFSYESLVTPRSVFEYDLGTRERQLLKQQPVLGEFDPERYSSERVFATAGDGTRIPISIIYRRELELNGRRPLLLEGYGSYGISNDVDFSSNRLSLLDRGVIYAVAHIRGGGELGKEWHDQGRLRQKMNTFTDFICCAEHLIGAGFTSRDRLIITGGSAGGLLMGAVSNMRPDLFRAVVSYVPFVDVMNTMLDASLPLTVGEYLEWGDPNEKSAWEYMRSYSPYENIEAKDYPAMLIRTSLNDSQVMYWEPAKYVARLRALKTDQNPLLFRIKLEPGGHGGASGRYDRLRDIAYDYAFIIKESGLSGVN